MKVYRKNNQYFVSGNNGLIPISASVVNKWREEGEELEVIEVENHD